MNPSTKPLLLISLALILLLLAAGCLDDLSSTLPPCYDGVKTSVITLEIYSPDWEFKSQYWGYVIDSEGIKYAWVERDAHIYDPYNNHNVTFSYEMVNGHRHITGIIEDHDAKPECECECVKKCCGCDE